MQDSWNFLLKASMIPIAEKIQLKDKATALRKECLGMLSLNDDLLAAVFDKFIDRNKPAFSEQPEHPTAIHDLQDELSQLLDSKLRPLLASVEEGVMITRALHDRLDTRAGRARASAAPQR
jgi:hypothetical protein